GAVALQDLDILEASIPHLFANEIGRVADLLLMFAIGTDAADGDELAQVRDELCVVLLEPVELGLHESGTPAGRRFSFHEPDAQARVFSPLLARRAGSDECMSRRRIGRGNQHAASMGLELGGWHFLPRA